MGTLRADGFWYASVGGAPTEIVRVHDGMMYSTGCADGHPLDGVELIEIIPVGEFPLPKADRELNERTWSRRVSNDRASNLWRNYRTFD